MNSKSGYITEFVFALAIIGILSTRVFKNIFDDKILVNRIIETKVMEINNCYKEISNYKLCSNKINLIDEKENPGVSDSFRGYIEINENEHLSPNIIIYNFSNKYVIYKMKYNGLSEELGDEEIELLNDFEFNGFFDYLKVVIISIGSFFILMFFLSIIAGILIALFEVLRSSFYYVKRKLYSERKEIENLRNNRINDTKKYEKTKSSLIINEDRERKIIL